METMVIQLFYFCYQYVMTGDFTFVCLADTQFGMAAWSKSSDMDHLNPELTEHDLEQKEQQFAEEVFKYLKLEFTVKS